MQDRSDAIAMLLLDLCEPAPHAFIGSEINSDAVLAITVYPDHAKAPLKCITERRTDGALAAGDDDGRFTVPHTRTHGAVVCLP
jgi:hypothetical protein